jgi:hypothetical protein
MTNDFVTRESRSSPDSSSVNPIRVRKIRPVVWQTDVLLATT